LSDSYKNGGSAVPRSYIEAVLSAGGIPVIIPLMYDDEKLAGLLQSLDGIIFTGGEDFDPSYYHETPLPNVNRINAPRDVFDMKLLRLAVDSGIPVLGICRGVQLINIAYGGSLYQDLSVQYPDRRISHRQTLPKETPSHAVIVNEGTVFSDIVGQRTLMVNSSHHQAIKRLARGFRIAGTSPDNLVEAIEKIDSAHWILGVQFHPEVMIAGDPSMQRIFKGLVSEASRVKSAKRKALPAPRALAAQAVVHTPATDAGKELPPAVSTAKTAAADKPADLRTSKEKRKDEMRRWKDSERQHAKEQKGKQEFDRLARKEKDQQAKADFKQWVQERKREEKALEQQAKQTRREQAAAKKAAEAQAKKEQEQREELERKEKEVAERSAAAERERAVAQKAAAEREQTAARKAAAKQEKAAAKLARQERAAAKKAAEVQEQQRRRALQEKAANERKAQKAQKKLAARDSTGKKEAEPAAEAEAEAAASSAPAAAAAAPPATEEAAAAAAAKEEAAKTEAESIP
jgi:gamma-glutamyl-gamma-aminobutyrate hydrolase PuuD